MPIQAPFKYEANKKFGVSVWSCSEIRKWVECIASLQTLIWLALKIHIAKFLEFCFGSFGCADVVAVTDNLSQYLAEFVDSIRNHRLRTSTVMVGTMCWFLLTNFWEGILQKRRTISSTQSNSNLARYRDNTSLRGPYVCQSEFVILSQQNRWMSLKPVCEHAKFRSKLVCLGDF
jgi:hypothetical protein